MSDAEDRTASDDPLRGRGVELTDARAMRAYAHPVRLALIGLLRRHGPLTATQAAARLGESSGTTSFHLRQLAKYGFCEEAGGGKGREKPWRATALFTSWNTALDDPERTEAERALNTVVLQLYVDQITRWFADRPDDAPEWQRASGFGDISVPLTTAELDKLRRDAEALVRPSLPRVTRGAVPPVPPARARRARPPRRRPAGQAHPLRVPRPRRAVMRVPPLLRENAGFRRFWCSQTVSLAGDHVSMLALPLVAVLA